MTKNDIWSPKAADVLSAMTLLTRFPIPGSGDQDQDRIAISAWAYPIVGLVLGILAILIGGVANGLSLPPLASAVLIAAFYAGATGAMHMDGLADTLDGLWGGWTKERRLEIMKDSRVGVYGVTGLVLVIMLNVVLIAQIIENGAMFALIGAAAVSRAAMVCLMHFLPQARSGGLSAQVGKPGFETTAIAAGLGAVICLISAGLAPIVFAIIAMISIGWIAISKIGGQTGDILGATQKATETAALIAVVWMLA